MAEKSPVSPAPPGLPEAWAAPPAEFSLCPFWFWNDDLRESEVERQIDDFQRHGVDAFVIHPRVGLPRSIGFLSERWMALVRTAVECAEARGMEVMLYDEAMYPSGSAGGLVVARDERFRCRGLALHPRGAPLPPDSQVLLEFPSPDDGSSLWVVERPVDAFIRGVHYLDPDPPRLPGGANPPEEEPPAADLLNPDAVDAFVDIVHGAYHRALGKHFGTTIRAIFTDEPDWLGRCRETGIQPGTRDILEHARRLTGQDLRPHLPALWFDRHPQADRWRRIWRRVCSMRMEETYYARLRRWCDDHGIALTGHPARPDDMAALRFFHIPGQDVVWRRILPDHPSALEGPESTQALVASSVMRHRGLRRNLNEYLGAYGRELTWEEMEWLGRWLVVRGANLLVPHAFYHSVRGPRADERPPDVGPNSPWWDRYLRHALAMRRLCWLNAESRDLAEVCVLATREAAPWRLAKKLYQAQIPFCYLDADHLWQDARLEGGLLRVAEMRYRAVLLEDGTDEEFLPELGPLEEAGLLWRGGGDPIPFLRQKVVSGPPLDRTEPALRVRHLKAAGFEWWMLFNEERADALLRLTEPGWSVLRPLEEIPRPAPENGPIPLGGHELLLLLRDRPPL